MDLLSFAATLLAATWWAGAADPADRKRLLFKALIPAALLTLTLVSMPHGAAVDKLLTRLALPLGLLWLGLLTLVALGLRRDRRLALAASVAWLGLTLVGNGWLGGALLAGLEAGVPPLSAAPTGLPAVAVLGGGTQVGPDGAPYLSSSGDRVRAAAAAWHRGVAPVVVASGTSVAGLDQADSRDLGLETRRLLSDMGVPDAAVQTLPGPYNTATEIAALARHARSRGWDRIGLITSAWHMPRALRLAAQHDLEVVPIGADYRGRIPRPTAVFLVPTGSSARNVQLATKEHLAGLVGR